MVRTMTTSRTSVDTDILNEVFLIHDDLQSNVDDGGFGIAEPILKIIGDLDWAIYHLRNSIDRGESYGENLELRSRDEKVS